MTKRPPFGNTDRLSRRTIIGGSAGLLLPGRIAAQDVLAQSATPVPTSPAANAPVQVAIIDKRLTFDDLRAAIAAEGELVLASEYPEGQAAILQQFADYVAAVYSQEIAVTTLQETQDGDPMATVYADAGARSPSRIDVMATRKNHWFAARVHTFETGIEVMEEFLPSGLVPNERHLLGLIKAEPSAVGFQASAVPTVIYNSDTADYLTEWTDLADERLKGRLLLWTPGDEISDGMPLSMTRALKMDYRNPDHIAAGLDFIDQQISPNVLRYTNDLTEATSLFTSGAIDAFVYWNGVARELWAEGMTSARPLMPTLGQYPFNGVLWIPVQPQHPILAQIFIDWCLSVDAQLPDLNSWHIDHKTWLQLHEGLISKGYAEAIPDWISQAYGNLYPS
ncbi:MAG TPA: extracellular solute-binding protein, partial [Thermomicrobiales bacterium]|nr:extracellular solute-binding protein [Thermomicrobiales bacterium]